MKKKGNTESLEEDLKMEEKKEKMKKKEKREGRIRRRCRKPKAYTETEKGGKRERQNIICSCCFQLSNS